MIMLLLLTMMTTTTTTIIIIINGLVKLEPTYNAAIVGLSEYVKQGKNGLIRLVQEYDARKAKFSVPKEANLIKQKYLTQETAAQNKKSTSIQH
jgi:hypothetical protein